MARTALLLVDHGSRRREANAELEALARLVRARAPELIVCVAHLELAPPGIAEAVAACVEAGAEELVVVPCFLTPGRHASEDVPRLVAQAAPDGLRVRMAGVLGAHPLLAELVLVRAGLLPRFALWRQDEQGNRFEVARFDTREEAESRQAELEAHTHEQCYWVERA